MKRSSTDYAIYGNIIVPLLWAESETFLQVMEDERAGVCQMVFVPRKRRSRA